MKNAMKKLMAFALVAVMLIGTLPFAASADESNDHYLDFIFSTKDGGYVMGEDFVRVYLEENATSIGSADITGVLAMKDAKGYNNATWSCEGSTGRLADLIFPATGAYNVFPVGGAPEVEEPVVEYCDECGEVLTDDHVCKCDTCGKPDTDGHDCLVWCDRCQESRFAHEHASYVDVILNVKDDSSYVENDYFRCELDENGTISKDDRDEIYFTSSKLNIVGWKADGYGQKSTLLDFNFAKLEKPINIYPVFANAAEDEDKEEDKKPVGGDDDEITDTGFAYIYVGSNDMPKTRIILSSYKAIGRLVKEFDDADDKHYEFAYYTVNGSSKQYDDTDVVGPADIAHIYVKVTESKMNDSKVYLQIYMNNDFETPAKTLNVTTMATEDGLNLYGNVEDLILDYFSAKTSSGIKMDGMYRRNGSWIYDFMEDEPKYKNVSSDDIIEYKEDKDFVVYNIMVTNAKLKSSGTADSTNPKTGDQIMVPVAIMAVSASVLAAVAFYLNKKRVY